MGAYCLMARVWLSLLWAIALFGCGPVVTHDAGTDALPDAGTVPLRIVCEAPDAAAYWETWWCDAGTDTGALP